MTGVVALHIPSWTVRVREERRQARKLCGQLVQEEWFVAIIIVYMESPITTNIYEIAFWRYKSQV